MWSRFGLRTIPPKYAFLIVLSVLIVGCAKPSDYVRSKSQELTKKYENINSIDFSQDLYVIVYLKNGSNHNMETATNIYRDLIFTDGELGKRNPKVPYVYINFYDETSKFIFQIFWDVKKGDFVKENKYDYY